MRRSLLSLCFAALLTAVATTSAAAATLRIDFTDLDLNFDGSVIFTDANGPFGFDDIGSANFFLDGAPVGSVSAPNVWASLGIGGIGAIPAGGGAVSADWGSFTLGTDATLTSGVALYLQDITLNFVTIGDPSQQRLALAATAAATTLIQLLPFGLEFDPSEPIELLFFINLANVKVVDQAIVAFNGAGTGSLQGATDTVVPEPASMVLLGTGLIGAIGARRRATRKAAAA